MAGERAQAVVALHHDGLRPISSDDRLHLRIGGLDRRRDLADIGLAFDLVIGDAHGVEHRLDDAHGVALRLARQDARLLLEEAHHHADRQRILDGDAADRVDRVEHAGLLDEEQRAAIAVGEPGADRDAFVLLADAHESRIAHLCERAQQTFARRDVGHRDDELDPARLDLADDARAAKEILRRVARDTCG